jgi:hypothetical protein
MQRFITLIFLPFLLFATKYAGEFQELGVGGRACAMGGIGVTQYNDPSVIYFNPAGSYYADQGILIMHGENFAGAVRNEFGSLILPKENISFGVGIQYLSVSDIKLTELSDTTSPPSSQNPPVPYDTVGTKDMVLYINGAKGNGTISFGANIKVFYRDLSIITGYGGGLDLGMMLNYERVKAGISVRDFILSPIIWSNGTKETIVPKITFGVTPTIPIEKISSFIIFGCDIVKSLDAEGFDLNFGFEYGYKDFAFGRAGIYRGDYSLGIGLKYKQFTFDYAFVTHSDLNNSNKFSGGFSF